VRSLFTLINLERLKMKTLANFTNYNEFIVPEMKSDQSRQRELIKFLVEKALDGTLKSGLDTHIRVKNKSPKPRMNPRIILEFRGRKVDFLTRLGVVCNMWQKYKMDESPTKQKDTWDNIKDADYRVSQAIKLVDHFQSTVAPFLKAIIDAAGDNWDAAVGPWQKVSEKGIDIETRKEFKIAVINKTCVPGSVYEALQVAEVFKNGFKGKWYKGHKTAINLDSGKIVPWKKSQRGNHSKQLDFGFEGQYLRFDSSMKAKTTKGDGGGTTSEYEKDASSSLAARSARFTREKSYDFVDGKVQLFGLLLDSVFFSGNPHAVRVCQEHANNKDTFVVNASNLSKFLLLIDVPEVLTDTTNVIAKAFDKLAVEV
jgi:hypothetical protein